MDWQLVTALACVAVAVAVLARGVVHRFTQKSSGGCGSGCGACPSNRVNLPESPAQAFVSLDSLQAPARKE